MIRIGLDIGTGFVKCVSDHCRFRFPSLCARRINGQWTGGTTEAVGSRAAAMLRTVGTTAISPIRRGRPDARYQRHAGLLAAEAIGRVYRESKGINREDRASVVVGLPYEAAGLKASMTRIVGASGRVGSCAVVAQAAGTLVEMGRSSGMAVSIGQGTSEIIVIEDNRVVDGQSLEWASEFITRKIGRYAHLDAEAIRANRAVCARYARALAENLAEAVAETAEAYQCGPEVAVSGGGILIPRVREELAARLKGLRMVVPADPVMSNAAGLHKLAG